MQSFPTVHATFLVSRWSKNRLMFPKLDVRRWSLPGKNSTTSRMSYTLGSQRTEGPRFKPVMGQTRKSVTAFQTSASEGKPGRNRAESGHPRQCWELWQFDRHFRKNDGFAAPYLSLNASNNDRRQSQVSVVAGPEFEPAARLLKRSLILRCFSLLSREKSLTHR